MQWLFSTMFYVQFKVSKSILVISVYPGLFFWRSRLSVTLRRTKSHQPCWSFEGSGETGPTFYLGRQQLQRLWIGQLAHTIIYQWSRMSAFLHAPLLFSLCIVCSQPLWKGYFMEGRAARENISISPSMDQWICVYLSGDTMFTP